MVGGWWVGTKPGKGLFKCMKRGPCQARCAYQKSSPSFLKGESLVPKYRFARKKIAFVAENFPKSRFARKNICLCCRCCREKEPAPAAPAALVLQFVVPFWHCSPSTRFCDFIHHDDSERRMAFPSERWSLLNGESSPDFNPGCVEMCSLFCTRASTRDLRAALRPAGPAVRGAPG